MHPPASTRIETSGPPAPDAIISSISRVAEAYELSRSLPHM